MEPILAILFSMWGEPRWLWGLALVPLVPLAFFVAEWRRRALLGRLGSEPLVARAIAGTSRGLRRLRVAILTAGIGFAVIAAARPQWGTITQVVESEGLDIVILLDTSLSMLAPDMKPDRLSAAKLEISNFVERLSGDRVALVPFAGASFVQCPLTVDYGAVRLFLDDINTNTIPAEGTRIGTAIRTGMKAFVTDRRESRVMVLITDGEDHESDPVGAARAAREAGVRIYAIGIGSDEGELIPMPSDAGRMDFLRDESGGVVKTRLDESTLREIASVTGGRYYRSTPNGIELDEIFEDISDLARAKFGEERIVTRVERYQWPLGIAVALLLCVPFVPDRRFAERIATEGAVR